MTGTQSLSYTQPVWAGKAKIEPTRLLATQPEYNWWWHISEHNSDANHRDDMQKLTNSAQMLHITDINI